MPKISILTPSFNHEKYVDFFINSILAQSFCDFELIIVDDASSDGTLSRIRSYSDPRIKLICHEFNKGINAALNTAFSASSGEIIVFCASDDIAEPKALEKIKKAFENAPHLVALYSPLIPINAQNQVVIDALNGYLNMQPKSRAEFVRYLFTQWNCIVSPGMAVPREHMEAISPLPAPLLVFQDYEMHVRLLARGDVGVLGERIFRYRMPTPNSNQASSQTAATSMRQELETFALMDAFLGISDIALLEAAFAPEIAASGIAPHADTLQFFFGAMALLNGRQMRKIWGYQQILKAYDKDAKLLHERYGFDFAALLGLTKFFGA